MVVQLAYFFFPVKIAINFASPLYEFGRPCSKKRAMFALLFCTPDKKNQNKHLPKQKKVELNSELPFLPPNSLMAAF